VKASPSSSVAPATTIAGLKLTESARAGLGHVALRASSPEAPEHRVRQSRHPV
jgi:hypothetical protein